MIIKSQRLRAIGIVAGMLAISVSSLLLIKLAITYISIEIVPVVLGAVALAFLLYSLYCIALSQIKYEDKIKEITQK